VNLFAYNSAFTESNTLRLWEHLLWEPTERIVSQKGYTFTVYTDPPIPIHFPSRLSPAGWAALLPEHPDGLVVNARLEIIQHGARIGYCGPRQSVVSPNLTSATADPSPMSLDIARELSHQRIMQVPARQIFTPPLAKFPVPNFYPLLTRTGDPTTALDSAFTCMDVIRWLRHILIELGVSGNYSGHSFRRGAATWARSIDSPDADLQLLGRWKSEAYKRYIEVQPEHVYHVSRRLQTLPPPPMAASHRLPAMAWTWGGLGGAVGSFAAAPGQTWEEKYEDLVAVQFRSGATVRFARTPAGRLSFWPRGFTLSRKVWLGGDVKCIPSGWSMLWLFELSRLDQVKPPSSKDEMHSRNGKIVYEPVRKSILG
jgi:hypothetical protein